MTSPLPIRAATMMFSLVRAVDRSIAMSSIENARRAVADGERRREARLALERLDRDEALNRTA